MRRIQKGVEPSFLTEYRLRSGAPRPTYTDLFDKAQLRKVLVERQSGLCCFCQRALAEDGVGVKIAHLRPQSVAPELDLSWSNLWAACDGHEGMPPQEQHCDTRQGDRECSLDPAIVIDAQFVYEAGGTIRHVNPTANDAMNDVLNLNCRRLVGLRKQRYEAFMSALQKRRPGAWSRVVIERELKRLEPHEGERSPELVAMLRYWLERRLARTS